MKRSAGHGISIGTIKELYGFVWKTSARAQILLSVMAVISFTLELAPLELQRRIINRAVDGGSFGTVGLLCLTYAALVLVQGGLKFVMNVYRNSVSEATSRRLRLDKKLREIARSEKASGPKDQGVAISIIVSEVEAVGGFVGTSFSEPLLNGGILLSIFGYMLYIQPWLAAIVLLLFVPQVFFIPLLQAAINRRTEKRIKTVRSLAVDIVDQSAEQADGREKTYRRRVGDVYRLNMQIFRRKFGMNFLMNFIHQLGIIGILFVGGWLLLHGRTDVGTIVAFISGLTRTNDPWGDLVNFFRDMTNAGVKYRLIAQVLERPAGAHATRGRTKESGRP